MGVQFRDYCEMLGVARTASHDEIQKAFRKFARKHHPEVNKDTEVEAKFQQCNEAYDVLKESAKRKRYDPLRADQAGQDFTPPSRWTDMHSSFRGRPDDRADCGTEDFSDIFDTLFGDLSAGSVTQPKPLGLALESGGGVDTTTKQRPLFNLKMAIMVHHRLSL